MKTLIKNSWIVNYNESYFSDILINNGKIVEVNNNIFDKKAKIIDAAGLIAFPGGIDPHVHMELPGPAGPSSDDFRIGSIAALAGGTTTMIDFITPARGQNLMQAIDERKNLAKKSVINCGLHLGISEFNDRVANELEFCIKQENIRSCKAYLAYRDSIGIDYYSLEKLMYQLSRHNILLLIHCEDGDKIIDKQQKILQKNLNHPLYHSRARNINTELIAVNKVIELAQKTRCPVYIVHVSNRLSVSMINKAKKSCRIFSETCPQYLFLDSSHYYEDFELSSQYVISPPLRSKNENQALWKLLSNGNIDVVSTDHCPYNKSQKQTGKYDFRKIPGGLGGIEYRMPLLYSYGVVSGKISFEKFVEITSTNAAKIFGLFPQKGIIQAGSDADIVLWNPHKTHVISKKNQFMNCDINLYDGIYLKGKPEHVILSGEIVFTENSFVDKTHKTRLI